MRTLDAPAHAPPLLLTHAHVRPPFALALARSIDHSIGFHPVRQLRKDKLAGADPEGVAPFVYGLYMYVKNKRHVLNRDKNAPINIRRNGMRVRLWFAYVPWPAPLCSPFAFPAQKPERDRQRPVGLQEEHDPRADWRAA